MKPRAANILISSIRRDGGTQIRAALDESTVSDYAAVAKECQEDLPPIVVYYDGADHWLSDGFHRVEGRLRAGAKRIMCEIRSGTQRDAILNACGANAAHGLRRSNADKRNAVTTLLDDPEWSKWSDRKIAKQAVVDHGLVATMRDERRAATSEKLRPVAAGRVAETPLLHIAASTSGQPTAGLPCSPANPTAEGDEGAASSDNAAGISAPVPAAAPDEPCATCFGVHDDPPCPGTDRAPVPSIDLLGLDDIDPAWLELTDDVVTALEAFADHMRQAQGDLANLLSSPIGAQLQALRQAAHDLAARGRKSVRPKSVCLYCKDPDGTQGRRARCNGCREIGWLTDEQLGAVPRELTAKGAAAKVIDTERGGYVARVGKALAPGKYEIEISPPVKRPPTLKVELIDEAGTSTVFEGDDAQVDW